MRAGGRRDDPLTRVQSETMKIDIIEHDPPYRVGIIIGRLSKESISRRLATALTPTEGFLRT